MGKQIGFFSALEDMINVLSFIIEKGDVILSNKNERVLNLTDELKSYYFNFESGFQVFISRKRLNLVKYETGFLDHYNSEVIELSSGGSNVGNKQMYPGRLYINMNGIKDGIPFRKSEELDNVYSIYKRYILKTYTKSKGKFVYYLGPKAHDLYKSGWKMMSGPKIEIIF